VKILLFGENGQLGHELKRALGQWADVVAPTRQESDLSDVDATRAVVRATGPDVIVNASAYTDVDRAEQEPAVAQLVNGRIPGVLGEEAQRLRAGLIHFSTDFVFDGEKGSPYTETDVPRPLGEYARSKLAGEKALSEINAPAIVFRTAWVYSLRRKSFVTTMLRLARERETMQVVTDQVGSPTFCRDLAQGVAGILHAMGSGAAEAIHDARGVYHLAGGGRVSRYHFARAILDLDPKKSEHKVKSLVPIRAVDFPLPAPRPLATPLDCTKASARFGVALPDWRDALARALADG
jgi:dTDP-4-dehydrorhamnose reductase